MGEREEGEYGVTTPSLTLSRQRIRGKGVGTGWEGGSNRNSIG